MAMRREGGKPRAVRPSFQSYIDDESGEIKVQLEDTLLDRSSVANPAGGDKLENDNDSWVCLALDAFVPDRPTMNPEDMAAGPIETGIRASGNCEHVAGEEDVLCGYLSKYKLGTRGISRAFKKRWFVFSEDSCKLLYYRTPQDMVPLGEISISCATFLFDVQNVDRPSMFEIRSKGWTYLLEAGDKHTMLYWLQELQKKRRQFSKRKTKVNIEKADQQIKDAPKEGLMGDEAEASGEDHIEGQPMNNVFSAPDTVGFQSARDPALSGNSIRDFSISNWRKEFRNKLAQWKSPRQSRTDTSMTVSLSPASSGNLEVIPAEEEDTKCTSSPQSTNKNSRSHTVTEKLSHIKNKLVRTRSGQQCEMGSREENQDVRAVCTRCDRLSVEIQHQKEENSLLEEELEATREMVKALNKQVEKLEQQLDTQAEFHKECCKSEDASEVGDASLEMLHVRDGQIVDLQQLLIASQQHCNMLQSRVNCCDKEISGLQEEISMYHESIQAKDSIVMTLTNRITELEQLLGDETPTMQKETNTTDTLLPYSKDLQQLTDACEAYRLQNQLLNGELLQLAHLRAEDEAREFDLQKRFTELEAKFYQVRSKWLLCLKELSQPTLKESGGRSEELVCQLLEDAINTEASLASPPASTKTKVAPQFDIYGFPYISHQEEYVWDEVELEARATVFLRKHDELSNQAKDAEKEISVQVKWENHLVSLGSRPLQRGVELKNLIRAGVPVKYRNKVWKACVEWRVCRLKSCYSYNYYEGTLALAKKVLGSSLNPIERQIEVDLLRTLPENKHYQCLSSDGIPQLRRVLLAYAVHNPEIGYCQGLNRITAIALLFLGEEDSFWCLVAIVESLLSTDHYSRTLLASHVDQRVLKDLVADKLPRLAAHFDFHKVDMSLFTFNWFMTIFIDNIPVETFLRIWDAFLYEGGKVLFRYALAFLKHQEENLLKCDNDLKLHGALRELGSKMTDINTIAQVAFQGINPFPMKHIQSRRQFHTQIIKVEMEKFETMRSALELTSSMPDSMAPDTVEYGLSDEETS